MQPQDLKLESNDESDHNTSEPLVNSPETKHLMEIATANGASVRIAHKANRGALTEGTRGGGRARGGATVFSTR